MIAVEAGPSNLGLRPPQPEAVPGCAKAPEALRGLHQSSTTGQVRIGSQVRSAQSRRSTVEDDSRCDESMRRCDLGR